MAVEESNRGWSRRDVLKGLAVAGWTAAGCASLPRPEEGRTAHPCAHRYCRYHVPPESGAAGDGHCSLRLRTEGGP